MNPVAVVRAAHTVRDELDHLMGGTSEELRGRLDLLLAEEGKQPPGSLADAVIMLIAQYGPAWERLAMLLRLNNHVTAEELVPSLADSAGPDWPPAAPSPGSPPTASSSTGPSSAGSTDPGLPAAGSGGADWLLSSGAWASPPEQPPSAPAAPAADRGPSMIGRLTDAFRRRRGERDAAPADRRTQDAFPLIESLAEVVGGWGVEVDVGLSPGAGQDGAAASPSGEPVDLDVQIIAEGFEAPGGWRVRLLADDASPYPKATLNLIALPQKQPETVRQIQTIHSVRGQVTGFGVRSISVLDSPGKLGQNVPPEPVAGTRVRLTGLEEPADITVVIVHGDRPGRLWWTYQSPHFITPDQAESSDLGMRTSEFGRRLTERGHLSEDVGRRVASKIPRGFWDLLNAVAGRVAPRRPSVLILSQEPHVPWELAVLEQPVDPSVPRYLNCQTMTGRWPIGGRRPELPPPVRVRGDSMAVVYSAAEAHSLVTAYGATQVAPLFGDILSMFGRSPDIIHFAAADSTPSAPGQGLGGAPFVFLEGSGDPQAFLLAGASGVVAPLWSDGPVGGRLAQGFYGRCFGGEPPAEVLRSLRSQSPATLAAYQFYGHPSLRLTRSQPGA
ncbi:hypothetical protein [Streptosporangium subroseum]|uniref:hypothetical protein n=1 Tax=Streptosporangium subroseum TaxID=106412 RepID=UPI003090087D|nr:CHAT domain-containing protein [Streptosporangium subroseum]